MTSTFLKPQSTVMWNGSHFRFASGLLAIRFQISIFDKTTGDVSLIRRNSGRVGPLGPMFGYWVMGISVECPRRKGRCFILQ